MGKTNIAWCDHSFNGWTVSRFYEWACSKIVLTSQSDWDAPLALNRRAEKTGISPSVFAFSLGDWLDEEVPIEWLAEFLVLLTQTPHLKWLLLTNRPQNYNSRVRAAFEFLSWSGELDHQSAVVAIAQMFGAGATGLPNVAIGVTVEDQKRAGERLPYLKVIPAPMKFLSMEPLLGYVNLRVAENDFIDWVIVGGKSGADCRISSLDAMTDVVQQCSSNPLIPVFVKQLGSCPKRWEPGSGVVNHPTTDKKGGNFDEFPVALQYRQFPKWLGKQGENSEL